VTSPDSNRKVVQELKKYCDEHEERTGRLPPSWEDFSTLEYSHPGIPPMSGLSALTAYENGYIL